LLRMDFGFAAGCDEDVEDSEDAALIAVRAVTFDHCMRLGD